MSKQELELNFCNQIYIGIFIEFSEALWAYWSTISYLLHKILLSFVLCKRQWCYMHINYCLFYKLSNIRRHLLNNVFWTLDSICLSPLLNSILFKYCNLKFRCQNKYWRGLNDISSRACQHYFTVPPCRFWTLNILIKIILMIFSRCSDWRICGLNGFEYVHH